MFRFDQLIRSSSTVRDVKMRFPQTAPVFEDLGFRPVCDDCSIEIVARRQGLAPGELLNALNRAVFSTPSTAE